MRRVSFPGTYLAPFSLGLIILSVYAFTLAPGITWSNWGADGGDYLSAMHTGGIPHPTGYPTYLALAKAFSLLPLGSLALKGNAFSAVCMAAASVFLFFTMKRLLSEQVLGGAAAFIAAMFFSFSPLVWSQSVITEVYGLHALFLAACLFFILTKRRSAFRDFLLIGLLVGFGMGNHVTLAIVVPLILLMVFRPNASTVFQGRLTHNLQWSGGPLPFKPVLRPNSLFGKARFLVERYGLVPKFLGVTAGAGLAYVTLVFYAASNSPVRWLNPNTLQRFWELLSGSMYHFYWGLPALEKLQETFGNLFFQIGWLGLPFLLVGIFHLYREREIRILATTAYILFASVVFTLGYQTEDAEVYLIPAVYSMAIWIGFGFQALGSRILGDSILNISRKRTEKLLIYIAACVFVLIFTLHVSNSFAYADASRDMRAIEYGQTVMREAPQDAIIFTHHDKETFSLWYYQYVEGERPDLAIVIVPFLGNEWYREVLADTYPQLVIPEGDQITRAEIEASNRLPTCTTSPLSLHPLDCDS